MMGDCSGSEESRIVQRDEASSSPPGPALPSTLVGLHNHRPAEVGILVVDRLGPVEHRSLLVAAGNLLVEDLRSLAADRIGLVVDLLVVHILLVVGRIDLAVGRHTVADRAVGPRTVADRVVDRRSLLLDRPEWTRLSCRMKNRCYRATT